MNAPLLIQGIDAREITRLIQREVVPALGCTEPAAVALAVAETRRMLGTLPLNINVSLSGNMLKNAMGVGIPGTGMTGLPIAIALGAIAGNPDYQLEVLRDADANAVTQARLYADDGHITIQLADKAPSKLYIDVTAEADGRKAHCVIAGTHTNIILRECNGNTLSQCEFKGDDAEGNDPHLTLATVFDYATQMPLEDIEFILEARRLNEHAASQALTSDYGHSLGKTILGAGRKIFGDTPLAHMMAYTSAACDARMGGCPVAVMSNSGSGNQGITATMPVISYARDCGADHEHTVRALMLSHLTSIYIKQGLGRLSALCGCVVASTGASAGIAYLMGGGYQEICAAVKNMVANLTGMICDGAKPSCAMKITSGVSTAMMSALLAVNGQCADSSEGIIDTDVDRTVRNLTEIGKDSMLETDRLVLRIMVGK